MAVMGMTILYSTFYVLLGVDSPGSMKVTELPFSDVAFIAQTHNDLTGGACAIGEQPIKGLLDPKAMVRLAVGEILTNLVWAKVTSLSDVKASRNWMYTAKLHGEGAAMYDAAEAFEEAMIELGIAIYGGKDSLSMAAHASGEIVKAPRNPVPRYNFDSDPRLKASR